MNRPAILGWQDQPCVLNRFVPTTADSLPDDVATLKAMVIAAQAARLEAEAKARNWRPKFAPVSC